MDPVAFSVGPLEIRWYGIMMAASMLLGAYIASTLLRKIGRDGEIVWDGLFWVILSGIMGARLVYVLTNLMDYLGPGIPFWKVIAVWEGGLSFHGSIIGGALATYLYFRNQKVPMIEIVDTFALAVSPGIMLVRFGNFMNGDILGYRWEGPWAMNFPRDLYHIAGHPEFVDQTIVLRHPTEIYGFIVGAITFATLGYLWNLTYVKKVLKYGTVICAFPLTYSLVRCFIEEPFRKVPLPIQLVNPEEVGFGMLSYTHLASIPIILIALWGLSQRGNWEKLRLKSPTKTKPGVSRQVQRASEREANRHK